MPPSADKRSRERARIVSAALGVFAERRYAGATMALIARRARVSEAALAKHFESKDDLLADVLAPAALEMVTPGALRSFAATFELPWDDVESLLRTFFAHHVDFVRAHREKLKPILREALLRPETFLRTLARRRGLYPRFVELVEDLKQRGELRQDLSPLTVLFFVLSTAWGYGFARSVLFPDAEWDDAEQAWLFASVLAQGFRSPNARRTRPRGAVLSRSATKKPARAPRARGDGDGTNARSGGRATKKRLRSEVTSTRKSSSADRSTRSRA